jgi:dTDP-4-dehydrorhamnose 3,5-epimerase-like enzyme
MCKKPYLIYFPKAGSQDIGYISIAELSSHLPFEIKRVFWTYETPGNIIRGKHAHKETQIVLVAAAGEIVVILEDANGEKETFTLSDPSIGLFIPPCYWHTINHNKNALQIALASTSYVESDYLRDKEDFIKFWSE